MPREAKLFTASGGSPVHGFLKLRANIPPRWIKNARNSRKRLEPEVLASLRKLVTLQKKRPGAKVAIREAGKDFRATLKRWEIAYAKENFYRGIRVLLELKRDGASKL